MAIRIDLSDERFPKEPGNECRKVERGMGVAAQYGVENYDEMIGRALFMVAP